MTQEAITNLATSLAAAGIPAAAIGAAIAAAAGIPAAPAPAAPAPAAPAPAAPAPAAPVVAAPAPAAPVVAPTWVYAVRKLGANTSAALEAKKAAKYLKEQVLANVFGEFSRDEGGKELVLKGFFDSCISQGLWDKTRDGESVSALGKSKTKREKAHPDAKAVYCSYVRILAMFRPSPVKKGLTLEKVFAAIDAAKKDSFPRISADKWKAFKDFVEAEITGA